MLYRSPQSDSSRRCYVSKSQRVTDVSCRDRYENQLKIGASCMIGAGERRPKFYAQV